MAIESSITPQFKRSFTLDIGSIAANITEEEVFTVKGVRKDHIYLLIPEGTFNAGLIIAAAWGTDKDELTVRIGNLTSGALNPASQTYKVLGL